jgi:hypothetical protein
VTKPINPSEVQVRKNESIPDIVFEVVNEFIVKNWTGNQSLIFQDDVVSEIVGRSDYLAQEIYDKHWMDIEDAYRKEGWTVNYDKPAYNESYRANFIFKK